MNQAGVNMEDNKPEAATRIRANQEACGATTDQSANARDGTEAAL
jgi:hypothetical protein